MELGQIVKSLGKYLHKALPNSSKFTVGANECTVNMSVYYVLYSDVVGESGSLKNMSMIEIEKLLDVDLTEMILDINITTYANKIRVNIIERSPEEFPVGHIAYPEVKLQNPSNFRDVVMSDIFKKIEKRFTQFKFFKFSYRR